MNATKWRLFVASKNAQKYFFLNSGSPDIPDARSSFPVNKKIPKFCNFYNMYSGRIKGG